MPEYSEKDLWPIQKGRIQRWLDGKVDAGEATRRSYNPHYLSKDVVVYETDKGLYVKIPSNNGSNATHVFDSALHTEMESLGILRRYTEVTIGQRPPAGPAAV